ncbi:MAG: hypothetical protein MR568_16200 [Eisenbergiella massiliensis]|uniref:hypothetical protein n=1 Tax=Eisenbergiella massiliensis TaxID=1720294 RepID=UPI0023F4EFDE|nr:hypothetical protein [Eisenbergiella massiliensis]MCI6708466.1 hypothetical protein [Eisenbergiella massiliensis]
MSLISRIVRLVSNLSARTIQTRSEKMSSPNTAAAAITLVCFLFENENLPSFITGSA